MLTQPKPIVSFEWQPQATVGLSIKLLILRILRILKLDVTAKVQPPTKKNKSHINVELRKSESVMRK